MGLAQSKRAQIWIWTSTHEMGQHNGNHVKGCTSLANETAGNVGKHLVKGPHLETKLGGQMPICCGFLQESFRHISCKPSHAQLEDATRALNKFFCNMCPQPMIGQTGSGLVMLAGKHQTWWQTDTQVCCTPTTEVCSCLAVLVRPSRPRAPRHN